MDGNDYVVLDAQEPQFVRKYILDPDYEARLTRGTLVSCFARRARECGWSVLKLRATWRPVTSIGNPQ